MVGAAAAAGIDGDDESRMRGIAGQRGRKLMEVGAVAREAGQADDRQPAPAFAIAAHVQTQPVGRRDEQAAEARLVGLGFLDDVGNGHVRSPKGA